MKNSSFSKYLFISNPERYISYTTINIEKVKYNYSKASD